MDITPEQKKQLDVWAVKRDAILKEISVAQVELDETKRKNIILSDSNTDIQTRINQSEGRLLELDKKEKERATLVSTEVLELEKQKATLVAEIPLIKKEVGGLTSEKNILVEVIENLTKTHEKVLDRVGGLDKIVESVSRMSNENISELKVFFNELKITISDILEKNKKVIAETDIVIERVPKILKGVTTPIRIIRPILNKKRLVANGDIPNK